MKRKVVISMIALLSMVAMGCSQKQASIENDITTEMIAEVISTEEVVETEETNEDTLYTMEEFAKIMGVTDETHDVEGLYTVYLDMIQCKTYTETYRYCMAKRWDFSRESLAWESVEVIYDEVGLTHEHFDFVEVYEYYRELTEKQEVSKEEASDAIKVCKWRFLFEDKVDEVGDYLTVMSQIYQKKGYSTEEITEKINYTDRFVDIVATVDAYRNGQKNNSSNNNSSGGVSPSGLPYWEEPVRTPEEAEAARDELNISRGGMSSEELKNCEDHTLPELTEEEKKILETIRGY